MTSQKGLRYDGSIDKYPITEGEIYSLGNGSKITIADITSGLPELRIYRPGRKQRCPQSVLHQGGEAMPG